MKFELSQLHENDCAAAFDLATQVFVNGSTLHLSLGVELEEYRQHLSASFLDMVREGLSVVIKNNDDGSVVACMVVTDFSNQFVEAPEQISKFSPLSSLTKELCRGYQDGKAPDAGTAILIDMAAVDPIARGQGLYQRMRDAVHLNARERGFKSVVGELSSATTQEHVINRLGH